MTWKVGKTVGDIPWALMSSRLLCSVGVCWVPRSVRGRLSQVKGAFGVAVRCNATELSVLGPGQGDRHGVAGCR